jgi:hypothetical protein
MTTKQLAIRSDLEAWERYINEFYGKLSEPMMAMAMEQRSLLLKLLLKVQTEEYQK